MSTYAARRLETIRRNEAELQALLGEEKAGLQRVVSQRVRPGRAAGAESGKRRLAQASETPRRKSARLVQQGEQGAKAPGEKGTRGKEHVQEVEDEDDRKEKALEWEAPVRRPDAAQIQSRLLASFSDAAPSTSPDEWRKIAEEKWGKRVQVAERELQGKKDGWKMYVQSRAVSHPIFGVHSPLALLQEKYADDPWRLLASCALMSRVSSAPVKEECLHNFFQRWPTPSDVLDAAPADVETVLAPLGLFLNRYKAVVELCVTFLKMPEFTVDLKENKIHGFGEFALDSFLIFVRGMAADIVPADRNLRAYCSWAKSQAKKNQA